jgi:hypothetical protein
MAQEKPNDGGVSKKVADAKKALDRAWDSKVSGRRPAVPAAPVVAPPKEDAKPAASKGLLGPEGVDLEGSVKGVEERNRQAEGVKDVVAPQKMHDGGKVKESGVKDLEAGETVLPKDKDKAEKLAMEHLGKKAKGVMSSAIDEEDNEPKEEEKHETKKEEKSEGHKSAKKDGKKPAGKKHVGFHGYTHKGGHALHHVFDDGSSETHNFALGDHAALGKNITDMLGSQGEEPAEGGAGGGQGGASPEPAAL